MDLYGPPLPPGYVKPPDDDDNEYVAPTCISKKKDPIPCSFTSLPSIGPVLPPHLKISLQDDSSLDDICGPSLHEFGNKSSFLNSKKADINEQAEKMKNKLDGKSEKKDVAQREEWMTLADTSRRNQLGAITRCLTSDKEKKREEKPKHSYEKNKKTSEELKNYNKSRRSESLMDLHSKKLKTKEKERSKKKQERKAFDRDEMDHRHFSKVQVNSVIDKAKFLNSRFASSKDSQYL